LYSKVEQARGKKQKEEQDVMEWLNSFSVSKVKQQKERVLSFGGPSIGGPPHQQNLSSLL